ncbi:stalk domain-containing protein [Brevibacillus dissolubilis]|uniref:stalk domain-containing protein n=1 Tax=Brevibacillus dissolubilis TaxID=1844116 RepID=UPI00159B9346|nr:stalk domain-containing protein [Brevibacillus dissolubilis]
MKYPYSTQKIVATIAAIGLFTAAAPTAPAHAATPAAAIQVKVNNQLVSFPDANAYVENSRTMVPVRFVSEALGAKVGWDQASQQVKIEQGEKQVTLTVGQNTVTAEGKTIQLDAKPVVKASRTYVPLRFVSEALGAKVEWNDANRLVSITTTEAGDTVQSGDTTTKPATPSTDTGSKDADLGTTLTIDKAVELAMKNNTDLNNLKIDISSASINNRLVSAKVKEIPEEFVTTLSTAQQKYVNDLKAEVSLRVNEYYLKSTESKIKLGAEKAFYDLLHAQADLNLKKQSLKRSEEQLRTAQLAFKVGTRAKTDVLQAEAGVAGAQAAVAAAESSLQMAQVKLNDFIGIDLNKQWTLSYQATAAQKPIALDKAVELAVAQRAEVKQKQEEIAVGQLNYDLIVKFSAASTWPAQMAKNDLDKAKIAVNEAKRDVTVEVSQAYYNLNSAQVAVDAYKKAVDAAKENYRLMNLRYQNGLSTTLEVIGAEEELANRENQYETAQHNLKLAIASYNNAMGN